MTIEPDSKDWTWVLERPCPACGFEASALGREQIAPALRQCATCWEGWLASGSRLSERVRSDRWSVLEYGCHVRDVLVRFDERLVLMTEELDPLFSNWDQDATALEQRYGEQLAGTVSGQLAKAAERLATRFESLGAQAWRRTGRRSDGAVFSVESLGRYLVHDLVHHVHDVEGLLGT